MNMKWKVEVKTDHRGGPNTESWERIYANYPSPAGAGRFGSNFDQYINFGGFGGVIPRMRSLTDDDLYSIAGHIMLSPKILSEKWGGGKIYY